MTVQPAVGGCRCKSNHICVPAPTKPVRQGKKKNCSSAEIQLEVMGIIASLPLLNHDDPLGERIYGTPPKLKRGRPKGSKNKTHVEIIAKARQEYLTGKTVPDEIIYEKLGAKSQIRPCEKTVSGKHHFPQPGEWYIAPYPKCFACGLIDDRKEAE